MKRLLYAPAVLFTGLLSAQIIATAHVYLANLDLLQATEALMRAGYLSIPNARVVGHLNSLATAMAGGLFFTLSIGAGLSLTTLIGVWLWDRAFRRSLKTTVTFLLIWIFSLIIVNGNGWNPAAFIYCLFVPLATAVAAIHLMSPPSPLISPAGVLWPVSAAIVLALLWGLVMDRHMFINIRDHLLLGNQTGRSITGAYYAFTLFPAQAFKSLDQKQIRTCVLDSSLNRSQRSRLEQTLRARDYLPVPAGTPADLTISLEPRRKRLALGNQHRTVVRVTEKELLGSPGRILADYSHKLDRNRMFRKLVLAGLLLGFPLILFTFLFCFMSCLPNLFLTVSVSNIIASGLCVIVGGILLVPVYQGRSATGDPGSPATAFSTPLASTRIAALRQACNDRRDLAVDLQKFGLEKSKNIAERYWLARSLAYAKKPRTQAILLNLADDPVPIVACQAFWAMGQRNNRDAIPEIIKRINSSAHWYIQMYGYRALRTLGWVQPRSQQLSY